MCVMATVLHCSQSTGPPMFPSFCHASLSVITRSRVVSTDSIDNKHFIEFIQANQFTHYFLEIKVSNFEHKLF